MKPIYTKLAAQYGSFLIAIGGVSITVLTVVLSAWRFQRQTGSGDAKGELDSTSHLAVANNRPALVVSLIIATFNSFAGAQLMAETVALDDKAEAMHFLLASVNIFIGVSVVIFAVMLLATEYRKENPEVKGVRKISRGVFGSVLAGVLWWMLYSVIWRMPAPDRMLSLSVPIFLVLVLSVVLRYLNKKKNLNEILLPVTFVTITSFTALSLLAFPLSLELGMGRVFQDVIVGFFVLAITATCVCLWFSARYCVGTKSDQYHLWPPDGWRCWLLTWGRLAAQR